MAWNYEHTEKKFKIVPEGKHRVRIKSAEKAQSKRGNDMLVLELEFSGIKETCKHYVTFLDDYPELTNQRLTEIFDSFAGIPEGNFNLASWVGQVGACVIKHDDTGDNTYARVSYFIKAGKYDDLPPWREPDGTEVDADGFMKAPAEADDLFD
jgi:hypothetical protein